jgi:DNA repair protein RecN (Recombination protein N)
MDAAQGALQRLDDDEGNALRQLNHALQLLQNQAHLETDFKDPIDALASSVAQVEDTVHSLRAYLRRTDLEPERLAELDARMGLWVSLARRYKRTPEDLPGLLAQWRTELAQLDAAADLDGLQKAEKTAHAAYLTEAKKVTAARTKPRPCWPNPSPGPCRAWACRAGNSRWR